MRLPDANEIRGLQLFRDCAPETFVSLVDAGFLQRFPRSVVLIRENDPADFLYVVVDGLVETYATHAGRETTLSLVPPVRAFILAAVLTDQACLQSARTLESSRLLMIPAQSVRRALRSDAGFMSAVVAELAACYRDLVKEMKNQKLRTGAERLGNWLLSTEEQQGGRGVVEIDVGKRVLASRLGMAPENLSRAFAALAPRGVEISGPIVRLHDLHELTSFAKPNPLIDDPTS